MAINFPTSPTLYQTYTVGYKTWVWNGYAWDLQTANAALISATAQAAFNTANSAASNTIVTQGVDAQQNTWISANAVYSAAAYAFANTINTYSFSAYSTANSAQANTVITQGVDAQQNTWISSNSVYSAAAYGFANTINTYSYSAYSTANSAQSNTVVTQGVDAQQNTWISSNSVYSASAYAFANSINTYAYSAYATANAANAIYTNGGVIGASLTVSRDLTIQGNLTVLGNTTTIYTSSLETNDSLIYLANNNFASDAIDIGFIGHYNAGVNAHAGIIRDPNLKEFIIFQGYTPEVQSNNLINIADPSFAYANLYVGMLKGNLFANVATVGGVNILTFANSAFNTANSAAANTVISQGVDAQQNTWISSNSVYSAAAYAQANTATTVGQAAYNQANTSLANTGALVTANILTQYVFANTTASTSNNTGSVVINGGLGVLGNTYSTNVYSNILTLGSGNSRWWSNSPTILITATSNNAACTALAFISLEPTITVPFATFTSSYGYYSKPNFTANQITYYGYTADSANAVTSNTGTTYGFYAAANNIANPGITSYGFYSNFVGAGGYAFYENAGTQSYFKGNVTVANTITSTVSVIANTITANSNVSAGNVVVTNAITAASIYNTPYIPRTVTIPSGTTITMNSANTDLAYANVTVAAGTLTIAAPQGTPYEGQKLMLKLQTTNIQTFSFNTIFTGSSSLALPTSSSGSNKYDYMGFIYNTVTGKWNMIAYNFGFTS